LLRRRDGPLGARFAPYLCCGEIGELDEKPAVRLRMGLPVALVQYLLDQCGIVVKANQRPDLSA
jgi:hypothetical protein